MSSAIATLATLWESAQRRRSTYVWSAACLAFVFSSFCWVQSALSTRFTLLERGEAPRRRSLAALVVEALQRPLVASDLVVPGSAFGTRSTVPYRGGFRFSGALGRGCLVVGLALESRCALPPKGAFHTGARRITRERSRTGERPSGTTLSPRGLRTTVSIRSHHPHRGSRAFHSGGGSKVGDLFYRSQGPRSQSSRAPPQASFLTTCNQAPFLKPFLCRGPEFQVCEGV